MNIRRIVDVRSINAYTQWNTDGGWNLWGSSSYTRIHRDRRAQGFQRFSALNAQVNRVVFNDVAICQRSNLRAPSKSA